MLLKFKLDYQHGQGEDIGSDGLFPITNELIYNYDFGDNWIVKITKYKDCKDFLESNIIDEYELEEAEGIVLSKKVTIRKNRPMLVHGQRALDGVLQRFLIK